MCTNIEMAIYLALLLLFTISLDQIKSMNTEVITTKSGKVRGIIQHSSLSGIRVQKFLNIPYAEAPVGELRFEKPRPRKPWNGTLNSAEVNIACFQEKIPGWNLTEDCLILNVWTRYPQPENASVMVYIHGGSFRGGSSGSPRHNGANIVAVGDVILVTINYRVSALGFLSTGDKRLKGNLGLFDQRLAMKWVKENIERFGGNPETITLFGLSAGAASVSAHTFSQESWPYFDRVILQSGNMLMPWALQTESSRKAGIDAFLKSVGCKNDEHLLKCLKNDTTHDVLEKLYTTKPFALDKLWYLPAVDGDFLKDNPYNLLRSGLLKKSSIILGVTKDEMFYANVKLLQKTRDIRNITKTFKNLLNTIFQSKEVYEAALNTYTPECTPTFIEALRPMVDFATDYTFTCWTRQEAILRSRVFNSTEVYLYRYSYATPVPYSAYPRGQFGFSSHGADFLSVWGVPVNNLHYPPEDQILSMRVILYWTNYAKTGDPNSGTTRLPLVLDNVDTLPTWPRQTSSQEEYLDMENLSQMVVRTKLREKYCEFLMDPGGHITKASSAASRKIVHLLLLGLTLLYNFL